MESTDTKTKRCNTNPHFTGHDGLGVAASLAAARLEGHESEAQVDFATDLSEKTQDSWGKRDLMAAAIATFLRPKHLINRPCYNRHVNTSSQSRYSGRRRESSVQKVPSDTIAVFVLILLEHLFGSHFACLRSVLSLVHFM